MIKPAAGAHELVSTRAGNTATATTEKMVIPPRFEDAAEFSGARATQVGTETSSIDKGGQICSGNFELVSWHHRLQSV